MNNISAPKVLVTGANGFIGHALCARLLSEGFYVRGAVRERSSTCEPQGIDISIVNSIRRDTDWTNVLRGIDVVIHLAARVHVMRESAHDPLLAFREVNVIGTERLAQMSVSAGVRRIIYISSIGVNGNSTEQKAFTEDDIPSPCSPYAISKWEAEAIIRAFSGSMEVVIVRPPLVYGPRAPGNFSRFMQFINSGFPLPFEGINNRKSFIYLENIIDALIKCVQKVEAIGKTYLVSDGQDVSTPELIRMIAGAMGKKARLFPCPTPLLKMIGKIAGKSDEIERLTGSLQIDSSKIRRELGWKPPFTMEQGIRITSDWFISNFISNEKNI
jgi:nucleoside-diphosphate-sugar epimerase